MWHGLQCTLTIRVANMDDLNPTPPAFPQSQFFLAYPPFQILLPNSQPILGNVHVPWPPQGHTMKWSLANDNVPTEINFSQKQDHFSKLIFFSTQPFFWGMSFPWAHPFHSLIHAPIFTQGQYLLLGPIFTPWTIFSMNLSSPWGNNFSLVHIFSSTHLLLKESSFPQTHLHPWQHLFFKPHLLLHPIFSHLLFKIISLPPSILKDTFYPWNHLMPYPSSPRKFVFFASPIFIPSPPFPQDHLPNHYASPCTHLIHNLIFSLIPMFSPSPLFP